MKLCKGSLISRDTPLKCSAVMQVGIVAPARLLLDASVHKVPHDQVRAQGQVRNYHRRAPRLRLVLLLRTAVLEFGLCMWLVQ